MGLDISSTTGNYGGRVGSYSGVHVLRRIVVDTFIKTLEKKGFEAYYDEDYEEDRESPAELLKAWIDPLKPDSGFPTPINYEQIPEDAYRPLVRYFLHSGHSEAQAALPAIMGLYKFVNHSDCDGWHSPGDTAEIAEMFAFLDTEHLLDRDRQWVEEVGAIFKGASDGFEGILYH